MNSTNVVNRFYIIGFILLSFIFSNDKIEISNIRVEQLGSGAIINYDLSGNMSDSDNIVLSIGLVEISPNSKVFFGAEVVNCDDGIDNMLYREFSTYSKRFSTNKYQRDYRGAYIQNIIPGSPADKAGLRKGGIISAINNESIRYPSDIFTVLNEKKPGDEISVDIKYVNQNNYKSQNSRNNGDGIIVKKMILTLNSKDIKTTYFTSKDIFELSGDVGKYISPGRDKEIFFGGVNNSRFYDGKAEIFFQVSNNKEFKNNKSSHGEDYTLLLNVDYSLADKLDAKLEENKKDQNLVVELFSIFSEVVDEIKATQLTPKTFRPFNMTGSDVSLSLSLYPNEEIIHDFSKKKSYFIYPNGESDATYRFNLPKGGSRIRRLGNLQSSDFKNGAWHVVENSKIKKYYSINQEKELIIIKLLYPDERKYEVEYLLTLVGELNSDGTISGEWETYTYSYQSLKKNTESLGSGKIYPGTSIVTKDIASLKAVKPKFKSKKGTGAKFGKVCQSGTFTLMQKQTHSNEYLRLPNLSIIAKEKYPELFQPEGKYEKKTDYSKRLKRQKNIIYDVIENYSQEEKAKRYENMRFAEERDNKAEIDKQNKIRDSFQQIDFNIESIAYEEKTRDDSYIKYKIFVNRKYYPITIPIEDAESLEDSIDKVVVKAQKQYNDNLVYEYFNFSFSHPITNEVFTFGPKKNLADLKSAAPIIASGNKKIIPPELSMVVNFFEPSGNKFLDAEETGIIKVSVTNSGKGSSGILWIELIPDNVNNNIKYDNMALLANKLKPGETISKEIEVFASKDVQKIMNSFLVEVTETYQFNPSPKQLKFETYPFIPADIVMTDFAIIDPTDAILKRGTNTTIKVRIQNQGQGAAEDITFKIILDKAAYQLPEWASSHVIDKLNPNETTDLIFEFSTKKILGDIFNGSIIFTEKNSSGTFPVEIEVEKTYNMPEEVMISGIENKYIDITTASSLKIDIEQDIPETNRNGENDLAIVFGIEEYNDLPDVSYAENDAKYMKEYFNKILGIPPSRIYYRINNDVTFSTFRKLQGWIKKRIIPDEKINLYFYYAGHGSPSKDKKAYLIPVDGDPNYIEETGVEISALYNTFSNLELESVTVFLDACFSGANRQVDDKPEMLLADARPVFLETEVTKNDKINIFAASQGNQVSSAWPDKKHGLFSYFLMKGMKGDADTDGNSEITYGELGEYINKKVSREAGNLDREQNPTFDSNDKDKIFIKY